MAGALAAHKRLPEASSNANITKLNVRMGISLQWNGIAAGSASGPAVPILL